MLDKILVYIKNYSLQYSTKLKPMPLNIIDTDVEVHTLLTSKDVPMYLWAIRSLIYYGKIQCPVIVHDDGKLTAEDYQTLKENIPGIRIISREEADQIVKAKLKEFPRCQEYRQRSIFGLKLFDFNLVTDDQAKYILDFDSDILFFKTPQKLIEYISRKKHKIIYNCELDSKVYSSSSLLIKKFPNFPTQINAGLIYFPKNIFKLDQVESIVDWLLNNKDYLPRLGEQIVLGILTSKYEHEQLDTKYSVNPKSKEIKNDLISKHYHSIMKSSFALEGIKALIRRKPLFLLHR